MKSVSPIFFLRFLAARGSPRGQKRQIMIKTCSPNQYGSNEHNIAIFSDKKNCSLFSAPFFRGVLSRGGFRKLTAG